MASFLGTSLWDNTRLNRILIVDPRADSICETLRKKGYGDHFLQLLVPVQGLGSRKIALPSSLPGNGTMSHELRSVLRAGDERCDSIGVPAPSAMLELGTFDRSLAACSVTGASCPRGSPCAVADPP
jgi:hypothetical protein